MNPDISIESLLEHLDPVRPKLPILNIPNCEKTMFTELKSFIEKANAERRFVSIAELRGVCPIAPMDAWIAVNEHLRTPEMNSDFSFLEFLRGIDASPKG